MARRRPPYTQGTRQTRSFPSQSWLGAEVVKGEPPGLAVNGVGRPLVDPGTQGSWGCHTLYLLPSLPVGGSKPWNLEM